MNVKLIDQAIFELEYYMKVAEASKMDAPGMQFALKTMRTLKVVGSLLEETKEVTDVASTPT